MWRKLHLWGGILLALPMLIVGVSTLFIAHGEAWGAKQIKFGEPSTQMDYKAVLPVTDGYWLAGKYGLTLFNSAGVKQQHVLPDIDVRAVRQLDGQLYAATKMGLYQQQGSDWTQLYSADISDVASQDGQLWLLAKDQGVLVQQGGQWQMKLALEKGKSAYDLNKLMKHLHTGEALLGKYDWIWMDLLGFYLIVFSVTGIWLWWRRSA